MYTHTKTHFVIRIGALRKTVVLALIQASV